MYGDVGRAFEQMVGKTLKSVGLSGDQALIEHLEMPNDVVGSTILSVEDSGSVAWDDHNCDTQPKNDWGEPECGHESLAVYNTHFKTNRGDIVLEYRNDSNGYYGGYLVVA